MTKIKTSIFTLICLGFIAHILYPLSTIRKEESLDEKEIVSITPFQHDAEAAVSITLDDGKLNNYAYALPVFEKYSFRVTFGITTSAVSPKKIPLRKAHLRERMDWNRIQFLSDKGHEIASHSVEHVNFEKLNSVEIYNNIYNSKVEIEEKTGTPCLSFVYPSAAHTIQSKRMIRKVGYVCARVTESRHNRLTPEFYALKSYPILEDENPSLGEFSKWIHKALNQKKWLILVYHNVLPKDDSEIVNQRKFHPDENPINIYPSTLDSQMEIIKNSGIWVAPMGEVARYLKERTRTQVQSKIAADGNKLQLRLKDNLPDNIYNIPLTLKVRTPWEKVKVKGALTRGTYNVNKGFLIIDALPDSRITIINVTDDTS